MNLQEYIRKLSIEQICSMLDIVELIKIAIKLKCRPSLVNIIKTRGKEIEMRCRYHIQDLINIVGLTTAIRYLDSRVIEIYSHINIMYDIYPSGYYKRILKKHKLTFLNNAYQDYSSSYIMIRFIRGKMTESFFKENKYWEIAVLLTRSREKYLHPYVLNYIQNSDGRNTVESFRYLVTNYRLYKKYLMPMFGNYYEKSLKNMRKGI